MSAILESLRAQLEPHLVCPKCGEWNRPPASSAVTLVDAERAACSVCGHAGPLEDFRNNLRSEVIE